MVLVTEKDTQLADNDMAQRLAPVCRIKDISWIKPGKVAWDWWNTCNPDWRRLQSRHEHPDL
ncbi:hypothetical protein NIB75_00405 [Bacteroides uniformis]|nr:hypothetical protein [Bacteroides uniformis]